MEFGDNAPYFKPIKSIFKMILEQFEDTMLRILLAAAIV